MSMTAYNILECRRNTTKQNRASRARMSRGARASRPSRESETAALDARRTHVPLPLASDVFDDDDVYRDTRPSGERESGSYSGTRQRNRIQFGPS